MMTQHTINNRTSRAFLSLLTPVMLCVVGCDVPSENTSAVTSDATSEATSDATTTGVESVSSTTDLSDPTTGNPSTSGTTTDGVSTSGDGSTGDTTKGDGSTGDTTGDGSTGDPTTGDTTGDTNGEEPPACEPRDFEIGALSMLDFTVKDAEYSKALDRIIAVSYEPAALHIYDPWNGQDIAIDLPLAPTSVSVGPSGLSAAIGHDGWVSYVDLETASLVVTHPVTADVLDVVLADNGYIYAFPAQDQWESIYSIELDTGVQTESGGWSIYAGTVAKLHPSGDFMYGADNGLSPSDIEKYDIQGGTAEVLYDSPYHGDYGMCGDLWMSEDGKRIFTRCGNVFFASTDKAKDMTYNGSFPDEISQIGALDHSSAADQVALIPTKWSWNDESIVEDTEVQLFDYAFLQPSGVLPLPKVESKGQVHPMHGRFVFYDCLGDNVFVIAQADAEASFLDDYGVIHL